MYRGRTLLRLMMVMLLAIIAGGCSNDSERVAEVAVEAAKRQAALDQEMTRLNREVADGTRRLVEAQGEADKQLLDQQQNLQTQRDLLDSERRDDRRPAPAGIAPVPGALAVGIACGLQSAVGAVLVLAASSRPGIGRDAHNPASNRRSGSFGRRRAEHFQHWAAAASRCH